MTRRLGLLAAPALALLLAAPAAHASTFMGSQDPSAAPDDESAGVTIAASAPISVSSPTGETAAAEDLHLPVQAGASIGLILRAGEVDLGVRRTGRVRLRLAPKPAGSRALGRRGRLRTKVVVSLVPRRTNLNVLMRSARL
jgi:hypothetical protein